MDLRLEAAFSKTELIENIDSLKNKIDHLRPLSQEIEAKVMQKLRLDWNYHSNAIEGNRLNYGETVAFLMTGITAKGKSLKDHLDIRGHNEAILFLLSIVKDRDFTESDIRGLHEMILVEPYDSPAKTAAGLSTTKRIKLGEYKTSPNHVKTITGEIHYYASVEETPAKMQELMDWYKEVSADNQVHPLVLAALFHYKFVSIHPFDDGNGRLSRILMNLILMRNGFPPVVIKMEDRQNYYALLSQADTGNYWPFMEYIGDYLASSLNLYLKAINGGDIDEPEDIDKEIALFKLELRGKIEEKTRKSDELVRGLLFQDLNQLFIDIVGKISQFEDLFFNIYFKVSFNNDKLKAHDYDIFGLKNIIDTLDEHNNFNYYSSLHFIIFLSEFKGLNNFSVSSTLYIYFDNYEYRISDEQSNSLSITKNYDQKFSKEDQHQIIKHLVFSIKNNIQRHL